MILLQSFDYLIVNRQRIDVLKTVKYCTLKNISMNATDIFCLYYVSIVHIMYFYYVFLLTTRAKLVNCKKLTDEKLDLPSTKILISFYRVQKSALDTLKTTLS